MSQPIREALLAEFIETLPSCEFCVKDWYQGEDADDIGDQLEQIKESKKCLGCATGEYFCACGRAMSSYEKDHVGVCQDCR